MADANKELIDAQALIGKVLDDRYRLESVLGQGGMGMVFQATQTAMGRQVAVKTLHPSLAMAPTFFERFKREAEVASRLKHPNIVTIFDFGRTADGVCYYVMEHLEGESLRQQVKRDGPMSLRRAVAVIEQIALGLAHAHRQGVIHRDMKPHNVMVTTVDQHEYLKVLDFGLVKAMEGDDDEQLTSTGQVLGTPQYMPPEQAGGESVDARSDLYSLGGVFYFCLTGTSPYGANSVRKALTASLTQPVPSVASKRQGAPVPRAVEEFVRKSLAKEREDRYQSAEEFIVELNASVEGLSDDALDAVPEPPAGSSPSASPSRDGSGSSASRAAAKSGKDRERSKSAARSKALPRADEPPPQAFDKRVTRPETPMAVVAPPIALKKPAIGPITRSVLIGLPLFSLAIGGTFYLLKQKPPAKVENTATVVLPVPQKIEVPVAPPRPGDVQVTLKTSPAGAAVLEDGAMIGKTPLQRSWAKDSVHALTFQLPGFVELKKAYRLSSDEQVEEKLEPVKRGTPVKGPVGKTPKDPDISAFE